MKLKINVTKTDILKGKQCETGYSSNSCPVYQALKRRGVKILSVATTNFSLKSTYERFPLPDKARDFISEFDWQQRVNPFSFEIDIPAKFIKRKKH